MPELSRFLGTIVYMYFNDHNPPHFHVEYGEYEDKMLGVTKVLLQGDYTVFIEFNDGQSGIINFKDELEKDHREIIRELLNLEKFNIRLV
jgi:hypothetical protein